MQFVKASIRLPEHVSNDLYIRNIKTKGQVEPGYFRSYAGKSKIDGWQLENFEWLDENPPPPASAEEEAARMYPKEIVVTKEHSEKFTFNQIAEMQRSAHITCAGMYTGEIERLKDVLHIDQTGLAAGLAEVNKITEGYRWVTEGRGPYAWNDDKYKEEMGNMLDNISEAATKALNSSGAIAHSVCCGKEGRTATMEGIGYIKQDAHDKEIERLKALLKETVGPCECEECQKSWNEYKAKHNL